MYKKIMLLALALTVPLCPAGKKETGDNDGTPVYAPLDADQELYKGSIWDSGTHIAVTKLSFGGKTKIANIRKESDNSSNELKIGSISRLEMLDPFHESRRYRDQEYSLMRVTMNNGSQEDLLFPRLLVVCAESADSNIEKAWFIQDIGTIEVTHGAKKKTQQAMAHQVSIDDVEPEEHVSDIEAAEAAAMLEEILGSAPAERV